MEDGLADLDVDPLEGALEAVGKVDVGSPTEDLLDEGVVRVAAADTLRTGDVVDLDGASLASVGEGHGGHVVHGDHLIGANVKGLTEIGAHEADDT